MYIFEMIFQNLINYRYDNKNPYFQNNSVIKSIYQFFSIIDYKYTEFLCFNKIIYQSRNNFKFSKSKKILKKFSKMKIFKYLLMLAKIIFHSYPKN